MSELCIKSDFTDFYDYLHNENSNITYNRFMSQCKQRGTALKYLRSLGIKTIDIKPVNQFLRTDGPLVVYVNVKEHNGLGKKIMSVDEAMQNYTNCVACKYYQTLDNYTVKYLQIGQRRFTLYFRKNEPISLDVGTLVDIRESIQEYNRLIGLPIFSIDYISDGTNMLATDFNEVQKLDKLNFWQYMSAENITEEIRNAIIVYNKY